ncbi:Chaperone protein fimC precursor [Serratia fonticola]|uniref:fimbrial biogenesis chaperone n=1 Tax=Serratia fonticola TaxID=47917 RepID=UPI002178330E|nr:molecular chaperone [Serratia fonticola]CAI1949725.1 Chaperone protein fimC precursor [Serratia fonticola]
MKQHAKYLPIPLLCSLLLLVFFGAQAAPAEQNGISFYVLRVIYPESAQKGVTLTAYNKSAHPYLMQSWVRPVDRLTGDVELSDGGQQKTPFIVTPPLQRLEANDELTLRIRRNGDPLPEDRESVFYISMRAIPATSKPGVTSSSSQMAITVVSNIKLFYRPQGLEKRAIENVAPKLHFRRVGNELIAENPTPYWLTFSRLKVGATELDKPLLRLMVPPKGQQRYPLPKATKGDVTWQLIDEDGWDTPINQQVL